MKLFALFLLIGSAAASLRGRISQQQALSVDAALAPDDNKVKMLYIRHGQSMGNAGSEGWSNGNIFKAAYYGAQAADGKLTKLGKKQARDGVKDGGAARRSAMCDHKATTLYTVSPLRRAMATFVISYIRACVEEKKIVFPDKANIAVVPELREKWKTSSESVGGKSSEAYILHEAEKECGYAIKEKVLDKSYKQKCQDFGKMLQEKWEEALDAAHDKDATLYTLKANAGTYIAQLERLSTKIVTLVKAHAKKITHVVAVAHSGTGRIWFGCAMARGNDGSITYDAAAKKKNLIFGWVKGKETLGNAGSMILELDVSGTMAKVTNHNGKFYHMEDDGKPMPYAGSLTKTDGSDVFTKECIALGVIPAGSKFTKVENFKYIGPDFFTKGTEVKPKDTDKEFAQAHLSNMGPHLSSISFAADYGAKLYSSIEENLSACAATRTGAQVQIMCGTAQERAKPVAFKAKFKHFEPSGATLGFASDAAATTFVTNFDIYKNY